MRARRERRQNRRKENEAPPVVVPQARLPKPRRSAFSRVFYSLFILGAVISFAALGAVIYGYQVYTAPGPLAESKVVQIRKGLSTSEIAADLESAGVISDPNLFVTAAYLTGSRGRLRAGEYQFAKSMSMHDVLGTIVQGKSIVYKISIPEGWTTAQALERVRTNEILVGDLSLAPKEGELLPDTYIFRRGDTRDDVVRNMIDSRTKLLEELWPKRLPALAFKTPEEAVILASIVEKETSVTEERSHIAAVFNNRLRKGMRLQSDPTIMYGITLGKSKLDRPLTRKDIAQTTPYNTYRINGLPPGPIANPGRAAIEATLTPAFSEDLYFVADGSGGHAFAETLDAHKKNVAKWREIERTRNQPAVLVMEDETPPANASENSGGPEVTGTAQPAPSTDTAQSAGEPQIVNPPLSPIEPDQVAPTKPAEAAKTAADAPGNPMAKPAVPELRTSVEPEKAAIAVPEKPEPPASAKIDPAKPVAETALPETSKSADPVVKQKQAAVAAAVKPVTIKKTAIPLKPGQIVTVAKRRVPIPVPKPRAN